MAINSSDIQKPGASLKPGFSVFTALSHSTFFSAEARQYYRVINLWEVDKCGAEETTIKRALRILRTDENLSELESLMAFLALV